MLNTPNVCKIHPSLKNRSLDSFLYNRLGSIRATTNEYSKLIEQLFKLNFLTIISDNPLLFQFGKSQIALAPNVSGDGVVFFRAVICSEPPVMPDEEWRLYYNLLVVISAEQVLDEIYGQDEDDFLHNLNIFNSQSSSFSASC